MIVGLPLRNLLQDGRGFRCNIMNYQPLHILPRINNPTIILERREYFVRLVQGINLSHTTSLRVVCYETERV